VAEEGVRLPVTLSSIPSGIILTICATAALVLYRPEKDEAGGCATGLVMSRFELVAGVPGGPREQPDLVFA
jgi:hypothetical protein